MQVSFLSRQIVRPVNEFHLRSIFSSFGPIYDVTIKRWKASPQERQSGYGFVFFYHHADALRAATVLKNKIVDGVKLDCNYDKQFQHSKNSTNRNNRISPQPLAHAPPATNLTLPQQGSFINTMSLNRGGTINSQPQIQTPAPNFLSGVALNSQPHLQIQVPSPTIGNQIKPVNKNCVTTTTTFSPQQPSHNTVQSPLLAFPVSNMVNMTSQLPFPSISTLPVATVPSTQTILSRSPSSVSQISNNSIEALILTNLKQQEELKQQMRYIQELQLMQHIQMFEQSQQMQSHQQPYFSNR